MSKPDNREDNVQHLQNAVQNTIENYREAEDYLEEFGDEIPAREKGQIEEKMSAVNIAFPDSVKKFKMNPSISKTHKVETISVL